MRPLQSHSKPRTTFARYSTQHNKTASRRLSTAGEEENNIVRLRRGTQNLESPYKTRSATTTKLPCERGSGWLPGSMLVVRVWAILAAQAEIRGGKHDEARV